jgi:hypothetical protein
MNSQNEVVRIQHSGRLESLPHMSNFVKGTQIMPRAEILDELKKFAPAERLTIIEAALQQLREELEQPAQPFSSVDRKKRLQAAAEVLFTDYAADGELTAFTSLDADDFHA